MIYAGTARFVQPIRGGRYVTVEITLGDTPGILVRLADGAVACSKDGTAVHCSLPGGR